MCVCVRYHFADIAGSNQAVEVGQMEVMEVQCVPQDQLSLSQCSSAWILTGTQLVSKFNEEVSLLSVCLHAHSITYTPYSNSHHL